MGCCGAVSPQFISTARTVTKLANTQDTVIPFGDQPPVSQRAAAMKARKGETESFPALYFHQT